MVPIKWGAGNVIEVAMASVVLIETDAGISGVGEFTPCGENYIEGHSEGVEAAIRMIGAAIDRARPSTAMASNRSWITPSSAMLMPNHLSMWRVGIFWVSHWSAPVDAAWAAN